MTGPHIAVESGEVDGRTATAGAPAAAGKDGEGIAERGPRGIAETAEVAESGVMLADIEAAGGRTASEAASVDSTAGCL